MLKFIPLSVVLFLAAHPALAASRFWVGGTGTWDNATTTHWATSSGGAGGASVPGSSDAVTFDGNSGGGTVSLNYGPTVQQIVSGAFTGALSFQSQTITLNAANGWNNSGSGTRTVDISNSTINLTSNNCSTGLWTWTTTTGLTFTSTGSTINFSGTYSGTTPCIFNFGSQTYGAVNFSGAGNKIGLQINGTGTPTFGGMTFVAPGRAFFVPATTYNVGTLNVAASNTAPFLLSSASTSGAATINLTSGASLTGGVGLSGIAFTTTTPSATGWDFGGNTGVTITAPSSGGSGCAGVLRPGLC